MTELTTGSATGQVTGPRTGPDGPDGPDGSDAARRGGDPSGALIELQEVSRWYQVGSSQVRALDGVDLRIAAGEYIAIMGSSGSGKSTLMNLLGCLDTPSDGRYLFRGEAVEKLSDDHLAEVRNAEIGFVFQSFHLLPRGNALENVELPLVYAGVPVAQRRRRARRALERVGLGERMEHRPSELSGGQRQRVAIARALINDPSLLLADEPTGNLDSSTSEEIMELMDELHRGGTTVILVTHETQVAAHAARRIELLDGRIRHDSAASG